MNWPKLQRKWEKREIFMMFQQNLNQRNLTFLALGTFNQRGSLVLNKRSTNFGI